MLNGVCQKQLDLLKHRTANCIHFVQQNSISILTISTKLLYSHKMTL